MKSVTIKDKKSGNILIKVYQRKVKQKTIYEALVNSNIMEMEISCRTDDNKKIVFNLKKKEV